MDSPRFTIEPWQFVLGSIFTCALYQHHLEPEVPGTTEPSQAVVTLIILVLSVGLSLLAGYLLARKNKATLKDDKPTTLVTRGTFMNWVLGVRRVGPLFAWAGERDSKKESSGKKGGGGSKQKVWFESGWHLLAIGPGFCLHRILSNGQVIFQGPITRDGHPSGSFIDLGSEGGFFIYWGEADQPVNAFLGNANRVGIASRWPYHCYVVWAEKRLGPSPNWPLLDYELEVRAEATRLTQTNANMFPTRTLNGATEQIDVIDLAGSETDRFELVGAHAHEFRSKQIVRLTGNACPDQDLEILFSENFILQIGQDPQTDFPIFAQHTRVHFLDGDLTGCDDAGTIQAYTALLNFGVNAAHAIDAMLHNPWPRGLGMPVTGTFATFDLVSLEALGVLVGEAGEALRTSWIALDGESVQTVLGTGLQDLGVMIPLDSKLGLLTFVAIRPPTGTLPRIREDLIVDELPEIEMQHFSRPVDRLTFSFPDRNIVDRDATIAIMDDGQISYLETQRARNIQITITTDFVTASAIAQRRSQEELAGGAIIRLKTNRATRTLLPGDAIIVDSLIEILRVVAIQLDPDSNKVILDLMVDFYGVPKSPFVDEAPPISGQFLPVQPDLQKTLLEVPELVLGTQAQTITVPRIRAHIQTFQAAILLSRDNITYVAGGDEFDIQTGGTLNDPLPDTGLTLEETGPEFTLLGPDINTVLDLTSDLTNWRLGRQVAVIVSLEGTEICFLRNVTAIGGDVWRLDGLLRARYDTLLLDHPVGAEVYIFEQSDILTITDPLLQPLVDLFVKTQPAAAGILPLDADIPTGKVLSGKGISGRPVPTAGLSVTLPDLVNGYQSGDDVTVRWDFGTPQSPAAGAGLQGAGNAIAAIPSPDEDFQLEIRDASGATIERTEFPTTNTFTYTNANIVADLGAGEPTFQVWIYQRRGGLLSDPTKLTVERI